MTNLTQNFASDDDTLGGRITHARDLTGMETAEVASHIGVTEETLAEWENDRSEPRSNKLMTLAGVMGVSPAWLISGNGEAPRPQGLQTALDEMTGELARLRELNTQALAGIELLETRLATVAAAVK
ncbi:transcriptional regulator with XRE-family HTH domain [Hoeflea marina]|uniref:Transcriptional regulator with XRE-family HTH domain n=1 Tax=Hoeflea marina TaxID=274592 RepID=A0A317PQA9_9HYPH|nr:helix-turn-helix domain-containing protein [Hoeflea marina]PWW03643.1 transcriptional regulator with XRE-family HTH domain [Hoeflea marina]